MNIALVSPNKNVYSETFVHAHREHLKGNIFHYFNGEIPTELEGECVINSRRKRIIDIFKGYFNLNKFSLEEKAVISSFKKNKIEVVLAEYGIIGHNILPVCRKLKIPLIVHFHGYDASRKDQLKKHSYYAEVFQYATFIIAVSQKMKLDLQMMGCPQEKLIYNVYGPRKEFFQVQPHFNKAQFIFTGRFVDKKAPYYLILAFKGVLEKHPNALLIMAGAGELLNTCKNLVQFYGLQAKVIFPGIISSTQFRKYLSESIALLQHSVTAEDGDSEGTPLTILEASAAGVPIISTRHAGIPDVIVHEKTGLLVEEHDVEGMEKNMLILLENKDYCRELGKAGRERIKKYFTLERHIGVLNDLIAKTQGALK